MANLTLSELKSRLAEGNKKLYEAKDACEQAVSKLQLAETGSAEWLHAMSDVGASASEVVRLQGGKSPEGKVVKGIIQALQEQIDELELETAWADIGETFTTIEGLLRDTFTMELGYRISAFGYDRIDFQVLLEPSGSPVIKIVTHGKGKTRRKSSRTDNAVSRRRGGPWTNGTEVLPSARTVVETYGLSDRIAVASGDPSRWLEHRLAYGGDIARIARRLGWRES